MERRGQRKHKRKQQDANTTGSKTVDDKANEATVHPSFKPATDDRPKPKDRAQVSRCHEEDRKTEDLKRTMNSEEISTEDPLKNLETDEAKEAAAAAAATLLEENIKEATALAIEAAAVGEVDVSAAANAAALEAANAATLVDAADVPMCEEDDDGLDDDGNVKKNEQRRKRYREKTFDEIEAEYGGVDDDISMTSSQKRKNPGSHEDQLAARRLKDRQRYATMTPEQRQAYNSKRREQYHRQSEISRQRRRERERNRYHALQQEDAKQRNNRRAKLERERYQKLSAEELESKNRKRRERAAAARQKKDAEKAAAQGIVPTSPLADSDVAAQAAEVVAAVKAADTAADTNTTVTVSEEQLEVAAAAAEAGDLTESADV